MKRAPHKDGSREINREDERWNASGKMELVGEIFCVSGQVDV